jgi:hypothetical protein
MQSVSVAGLPRTDHPRRPAINSVQGGARQAVAKPARRERSAPLLKLMARGRDVVRWRAGGLTTPPASEVAGLAAAAIAATALRGCAATSVLSAPVGPLGGDHHRRVERITERKPHEENKPPHGRHQSPCNSMLSVVELIAHQTASSNSEDVVERFSGRIQAPSAKTEWRRRGPALFVRERSEGSTNPGFRGRACADAPSIPHALARLATSRLRRRLKRGAHGIPAGGYGAGRQCGV